MRPLPWFRLAAWFPASSIHSLLCMTQGPPDPSEITLDSHVIRANVSECPISAYCFLKCCLPVFPGGTFTCSHCPSSPRAPTGPQPAQSRFHLTPNRQGWMEGDFQGPSAGARVGWRKTPLGGNAGKIAASSFEFQNMELFGTSIGKFCAFLFCTAFRDKNGRTIWSLQESNNLIQRDCLWF